MSNPWSIGECVWCNQSYCWECTEAEDFKSFCCKRCEGEALTNALWQTEQDIIQLQEKQKRKKK